MDEKSLEGILTLFAFVVLVDRKVRTVEVECFADSVERISEYFKPEYRMSRDQLTRWFRSRRKAFLEQLENAGSSQPLWDSVFSLEDFPYKEELLFAMLNIAKSDAEYHDLEKQMIRKASTAWDLKLIE